MDALSDPQYKTDDGSALRIWRDTAINKFVSEQQGRVVHDEVIYGEVISPGSASSAPVFELVRFFCAEMGREEPKYGAKYVELKKFVDDFTDGEKHDASLTGTPLSQWAEMPRSLAATLKVAGVFSMEALAALADSKLIIVGPDGRTWREKAKAYIENAKNAGYATELAAKVEQLTIDIAAGVEREKAMAARIAELEAASKTTEPAPAKPGKPTPPTPVI